MRMIKGFLYTSISCLFAGFSNSIFALGLDIPFQSAADIGDGRAGTAAVVRDASTNYANPAGLVRFQHPQLVLSDIGVLAHLNFNGVMTNPGIGSPVLEKGSAASTPTGVVPALHYVYPLAKNMALGFSFVVPSGLGYDYPPTSMLRYEAVNTKQSSASMIPSFAYRINPYLSIGIGGDAYFTYARSTVMARTEAVTPGDSKVRNTASGWDFGWHGGVLYEVTPRTRIGLAYHSKVILHLFGNSRFWSNDNNTLPSAVATNFRTTVPIASKTNLSVYHDVTSRWALLGSVEYQNWHIYKYDHAYNVASPAGPQTITLARRLHDVWYYAIGTSYQMTEWFLLRGGIDYDRGTSTNANRQIGLTDANLFDIDLGAHFQMTKTLGLDIGGNYAIIYNTVTVNHTNPASGNRLVGRVTGSGQTLGIQLTWDLV